MSIKFTEIFSKKGAPSTLRREAKKRKFLDITKFKKRARELKLSYFDLTEDDKCVPNW